jgi:hypothetical protein
MKRNPHHTKMIVILAALAGVFYLLDYIVTHDLRNLAFSFFNNMASVFIYVLLVTMLIDRLLNERERKAMLEKLNMVIGVFFAEVGTSLLSMMTKMDKDIDSVRSGLHVTRGWNDDEFETQRDKLKSHKFTVAAEPGDLEKLNEFLKVRRDFLVRLLENPVLYEHETFTETLRAVFHLDEELESRDNLATLPSTDIAHIEVDITRAYSLITGEWLNYMKYLKKNYPYLFSHAVRMNPFDKDASPVVK